MSYAWQSSISHLVLASFCSIHLIADGPFGLYSPACNGIVSLCINTLFSPSHFLQWGKHSYCFLATLQFLYILCLAFSYSSEKSAVGTLLQECALFTDFFLNYYVALPFKKWGMERDFLLTSFAPSQKSCHMHFSFLHQGREYLAGAATGSTLGSFFWWKQVEDWRNTGQGSKKN